MGNDEGDGFFDTILEPVVAAPAEYDVTDVPRAVGSRQTATDRGYRSVAVGSGLVTLTLLVLIGAFLLVKAEPAFRVAGWHFFTERFWYPELSKPRFGILAALYWTVIIALTALAIAAPLAVMCALFITEYAPRAARRWLVAVVDLLAAIPSIVYGLWGVFFLRDKMVGPSRFLTDHFSWFPLFRTSPGASFIGSPANASLVVALMILPIITSVVREVFSSAPPSEREAALALGSTRWGMIRAVVLPFGRGGIIGGSMLGLGRALGETIAVTLLLNPSSIINLHVLQSGGNSIAGLIATRFGELRGLGISALMAAGLVLFALTLLVNTLASAVVARSRSGSAVEI